MCTSTHTAYKKRASMKAMIKNSTANFFLIYLNYNYLLMNTNFRMNLTFFISIY